jgi:hypothetical protein
VTNQAITSLVGSLTAGDLDASDYLDAVESEVGRAFLERACSAATPCSSEAKSLRRYRQE